MGQDWNIPSTQWKSRLRNAETEAEKTAAVRILPVLVQRSGCYDNAEDLVGFWGAALGLALVAVVLSYLPQDVIRAPAGAIERTALLPVLGVVIAGTALGGLLATQTHRMARLFIPRTHRHSAIRRRAQQIHAGVTARSPVAAGRPVLVLYVGLYERWGTVFADEALRSTVGRAELETLEAALRAAARSPDPCASLCAVVTDAARRLAPHYPPRVVSDGPEVPCPAASVA